MTSADQQQTNHVDDLPVFPAEAPAVFADPAASAALLTPVFDALADIVVLPHDTLAKATPCRDYSVAELRDHVLAWLQFFATSLGNTALTDPDGAGERIDPDGWTLPADADPFAIVESAAGDFVAAIEAGVASRLVVMSQARMRGDAVVAMALGEYIVHGWDLAVATGRPWSADDAACGVAREFLVGTVSPEFRGENSGFFGDEVPVADNATPLDKLLGFAGRDPNWQATEGR